MEIITKIPNEIKFNVFKFMSHPVSEIMKKEIEVWKQNLRNRKVSHSFYEVWKANITDGIITYCCNNCECWYGYDFIEKSMYGWYICHRCKYNYKGSCRKLKNMKIII